MQCPRCQQENPPGARFCSSCGAGLELTCPACRISALSGAISLAEPVWIKECCHFALIFRLKSPIHALKRRRRKIPRVGHHAQVFHLETASLVAGDYPDRGDGFSADVKRESTAPRQ